MSSDTPTMSGRAGGAEGVEPSPPQGGSSASKAGNGQNGEKETKPAPKASKLVNAMAIAAGYAATPESAAHRNNNPIGQPQESASTKPPTATGKDGATGMCIFASSDDGIRAAEAFTKDMVGGKIPPYTADMTLQEAAATYWPQDPTGWAKTLAKELSKDEKGGDTGKVTPDSKLSELEQ